MLQFFQGANLQQADIKFSVYDFHYRLKKIEKICSKEGVDGLLIITGVDGRENSEYTKIINWVLLGHSGVEVESNEFLDANLSDMILLIKPTGVSVYCDRQGWDAVKSKFVALPNLEVFVPNEDEDDNKDESELLKISQFLKMMNNIKKVGVLLGVKEKNKLSHIEKWPLIQSYGLEQLGRGFFSMYHQVVDLTARINSLYKVHDKHSLKYLFNVIAQRLNGHTTAAVGQISDLKMSKRTQISEDQLAEVFQDTFEIEEMNKFVKLRTSELLIPSRPRVLIGSNTNLDRQSSASTIKSLGLSEDTPALHLTIETFDLLSSLRCARTYFLSRQVEHEYLIHEIMNDEGFIESYGFEKSFIPHYRDEMLLMQVYRCLIQSFQEVMQIVTKDYRNLTQQFIFNFVQSKLNQITSLAPNQHASNLSIIIGSYNALGEEVPINFKDSVSFKLTPNFFLLRLQYSNIMSLSQPTKLLGSVLFAESFILQENCYYQVTHSVPNINTFNVHGSSNSDTIELLKKRLVVRELGKQLSEPCDKNRLFIPTDRLDTIPFYSVMYVFHERGMRLSCENLGSLIMLFDTLEDIEIITGGQYEHTWLLCSLNQGIMFETLGGRRIALEFVGQAVTQILFPLTKLLEESGQKIKQHQNIPNEFKESHLAQSLLRQVPLQPHVVQNEVMNASFLLDYLESKQLTILNQMKDLKLVNYKLIQEQIQEKPQASKQPQSRTGLILITGGMSTGKSRFAYNLSRYAVDNQCEASILDFGLLEQTALNEAGFMQKLKTTIREKQQRTQSQSVQVCICVVPFFLNLDELLTLLDGESSIFVRCVVNKVNSNYFYVGDHSQVTQSMISLCQPGYCQMVMLDTFGNYESDLDDLSRLMRNILPDQQILRITNNIIQIHVAQTIYLDESYTSDLNVFMRTKLATLRCLPKCQLDRLFISWRVPMRKDKTRRMLRQIITPKPIEQVVDKHIPQEEQDLQRLVEKVKMNDLNEQSTLPRLQYVKGFLRYEETLKDGIVEITGNQNYVTEREVKNVQVQLVEIVVDGNPLQDATYQGWKREEDMGFLLCGTNLSREYCITMLQNMGRGAPIKLNHLVQGDLSEDQLQKIEFENRGQRLDHGYFYDGRMFRDEDGLIVPHHPRLNEFIQEFLEQENVKVDQHNKKIMSEWESYLKAFK